MKKYSGILKNIKKMVDNTTYSGIILAAGDGLRFGKKKQFVKLKGKPIWKWSYDVAKKCLDEVVVVGVDFKGGKTRQESVKIGLKHITGDKVIIFDASRPLVTEEQVEMIKEAVLKYDSVSFGIKPSDTIYSCPPIFIYSDWSRKELIALQVPQAFDTFTLKVAHSTQYIKNATDDTILMFLQYRIHPIIIEGGINLHKLTYPEDLKIIKALCQ